MGHEPDDGMHNGGVGVGKTGRLSRDSLADMPGPRKIKTSFTYQSSGSQSLKPFANGLLAIFS